MKKTTERKRVNRKVKHINKNIRQDVFKDRFEVRQYRFVRKHGTYYYCYKLIDHKDKSRNKIIWWKSGFEILNFQAIEVELNDFIVTSDFWKDFRKSEI